MASREAVLQAVVAAVTATGQFQVVGRRLLAPETITPQQSPAVFLVVASDDYETKTLQPRKLTLTVKAFIYGNVGDDDNAIPESVVNNALDALDAAFPANPVTGRYLSNLVSSCIVSGEAKRGFGELSGQALGVASIKIVFP